MLLLLFEINFLLFFFQRNHRNPLLSISILLLFVWMEREKEAKYSVVFWNNLSLSILRGKKKLAFYFRSRRRFFFFLAAAVFRQRLMNSIYMYDNRLKLFLIIDIRRTNSKTLCEYYFFSSSSSSLLYINCFCLILYIYCVPRARVLK